MEPRIIYEAMLIMILSSFLLIWGIRVGYNRGRTNKSNVSYMLMCIFSFMFCAPFSIMMISPGSHTALLSYISSLGGIEISMFLFTFMFSFYSKSRKIKILEKLFPIFGFIIITLRFLLGGFSYGKSEFGVFYKDVNHPLTYVHYIYVAMGGIFTIIMLIIYHKRSILKRQKLCLKIWILLAIISLYFMDIKYIFEVNLEEFTSPREAYGIYIMSALFYIVTDYANMFELSPGKLTEMLSMYSTQPIVILDYYGLVTFCNNEYIEFFKLGNQKVIGKDMFHTKIISRLSKEEAKELIDKTRRFCGAYTADTIDGRHINITYRVINDRFNETRVIVNIINDITETVAIMNDLDKKKQEAEVANEAKSSFLANMSHEIRTPLNAILGFNEMIINEDVSPAVLEYAKNIDDAGQTLLSLINDILDFSKIESGKMEIVPVSYDVGTLINNITNIISKKIKDKNLKFITDISDTIPEKLYGDEIRIRQIILNILNNAAKYTNEGSITEKIYFEKTTDTTGNLIISVSDTGIGIKEDELSKIFDTFQRINMKANRQVEGSGLGLAITKQLTDQMNGSIKVESEYGKGSVFTISIPQEIIDANPISTISNTVNNSSDKKAFKHTNFTAPLANILIVDDNKVNLTVAKGLLKFVESTINTASSGPEALSLIKQNRYDIIFLDHMMPVMDGEETLKQIKSLSDNASKDAIIIALTANAISGSRELYLNMGFDDYLTKPIDSEKLYQLLEKYLDSKLIIPS